MTGKRDPFPAAAVEQPKFDRHLSLQKIFTRQQRLLNSADFQQVFKKPSKSSDKFFTVLAKPTNQATARLGLAIARKQLKRAVDRNRIKRLVREHFRQSVSQSIAFDYVVMARAAVRIESNKRLQDSLVRHFRYLQQQTKHDSDQTVT